MGQRVAHVLVLDAGLVPRHRRHHLRPLVKHQEVGEALHSKCILIFRALKVLDNIAGILKRHYFLLLDHQEFCKCLRGHGVRLKR